MKQKTISRCDKCFHGYFKKDSHVCSDKIIPAQKQPKNLILVSTKKGDVWRDMGRKKVLVKCRQFEKCENIVERYSLPFGRKGVLCFNCRESYDKKRALLKNVKNAKFKYCLSKSL